MTQVMIDHWHGSPFVVWKDRDPAPFAHWVNVAPWTWWRLWREGARVRISWRIIGTREA